MKRKISIKTKQKIRRLRLVFSTSQKIELVNLTSQIEKALRKSGVKDGFCLIYSPHTTAAIIINENEPGLHKDIIKTLDKLLPKIDYQHQCDRQNAQAHILTSLIGQSRVIPITSGKLQLGTWQSIFFLELDGPRSRKVLVTFCGT